MIAPIEHEDKMGWEEKLTSALAHHQEGRLAPAIHLYREVLAEQPEQPDANHLYGLALDGEGDTAVGLAHVEKAVALEPGHPVYLSNLGYLLGKLGRGEDAERACRASIAADGTDADAHNNLGLALEVQDRLDDAAAAYVAALATEPRHMNAMMNRGDVLRRMGRTEDALGWFEAARAIDPRHPPAILNLASLLVEEGRAREAEPLARELVAMVPGYAKAHNALGAALKGLKNYAAAEAAFRRAAAIEPEYLKFTVNLAGTLAEQKNTRKPKACSNRCCGAHRTWRPPMQASASSTLMSENTPPPMRIWCGRWNCTRTVSPAMPCLVWRAFIMPISSAPWRRSRSRTRSSRSTIG